MMSGNENSPPLPEGDFGTNADEVLDAFKQMEGHYVFNCGDCEDVFETVLEWGEHSLTQHKDRFPSVYPVRKQ